MGRRTVEHKCAKCGKRINGTATECMGCLRLFHSACLQRVKLKNKRPSYMMCEDCILDRPMKRVLVGPTRIDEETIEASPGLSASSRLGS
jgi:hypothetical protein